MDGVTSLPEVGRTRNTATDVPRVYHLTFHPSYVWAFVRVFDDDPVVAYHVGSRLRCVAVRESHRRFPVGSRGQTPGASRIAREIVN
jgi:hypothetical protein